MTAKRSELDAFAAGDASHRTLVGFDFPYGYPSALGLTDSPAWLGVWREIASRIIDRDDKQQ